MTRRVPALVLTVVGVRRDRDHGTRPHRRPWRRCSRPFAPNGCRPRRRPEGSPRRGSVPVSRRRARTESVASSWSPTPGSTEISADRDVAERRAGHGRRRTSTVAPHDRTVLDLDAQLSGQIVSAVVEVDGGGAIVEQRAFHPAGTAVSPCANSTSGDLVPGRRLHGRREPEPDRAHQPVRRRRDRRRRLRHRRRVTHAVAVPGLPDRRSQREGHRSRGGGRGRPG